MDVLFLSTSDIVGGAAVVTYRLMEALRRKGLNARMLVGKKDSDSPFVAQVGQWKRKMAKMAERAEIFAQNGFDRLDLWKVSSGHFGVDIVHHPWIREADVIVIGWINQGFLSLSGIRKLCRLQKPVYWWMHDLWCISGICHLPESCQKWKEHCDQCPFLHKKSKTLLSQRVWRQKRQLFKESGIHFLTVSTWQKELAMQAPLLSRQSVDVLPHAFPIGEYPVGKRETDKRLIVMAAVRLDDSVKDLPMAIQSLNLLAKQHPEVLSDSKMVFVGGIKDGNAFKELQFPYEHRGNMPLQELGLLYSKATVVLSTSRFETMGATLMEGMAAGATAVTFGIGGQTDIVKHGLNGYVADYGSAESMSEYIYKALENPFPREEQHDFVSRNFSEDAVAERFLRIIGNPEV